MDDMTVTEILRAMTPEAKKTIENAGSSRIGCPVNGGARRHVLAELRELGVVGSLGGLSIAGSAVAERLQSEQIDRMFG